jgi:hypothetical protein
MIIPERVPRLFTLEAGLVQESHLQGLCADSRGRRNTLVWVGLRWFLLVLGVGDVKRLSSLSMLIL